MRSNLLSLQNISGQVSSTQNKLATGNKVNSAIDNPSSYYTARSLNNRADDLNALLDSMGQAVSTIKAATTALESATEFLEQAKAVANQALETAKVPDKSFFEEKVGENGAVVTTAQELKDAIAAGKETICVYGAIDLGDITTSGGLNLKENQKLVGVGYFGNYDTDTNKFSSISATANASSNMIDITRTGCLISDLSLNFVNMVESGSSYVVRSEGQGVSTSLGNLDIKAIFSENNVSMKAAILTNKNASTNINGKINIINSGQQGCGILSYNNSIVNIGSKAQVNIKTLGDYGYGIYSNIDSTTNVLSRAEVNITTLGSRGYGINILSNSKTNIQSEASVKIYTEGSDGYGVFALTNSKISLQSGASLDIKTLGNNGYGFYIRDNSSALLNGNIKVNTQQGYNIFTSNIGNNTIELASSTQLYLFVGGTLPNIYNSANNGAGPNILDIAAGAKLAFEKDGKINWYKVEEKNKFENSSTTTGETITADNVTTKLRLSETSAWELPEKVEIDFEDTNSSDETAKQDLSGDSKQYQEIINQYDALIKDAGYKGINLLQPEKLTVKFNEDNTAALEVQGRDMSSKALGFTIFEWQTQADINKSIEELSSAINAIRNYSSELGNNYNIITTRQDFTESLVNVLTEGADKLTLADMNEESANMLALQTRQQLAINSLSLASQASQSILKLF